MTAIQAAYTTDSDTIERRNELVLSELSQVYYRARRIHERLPQHVDMEELVQAGVLGLIDAAARFDGTRDIKFSTFAKFRINGAILDSLRRIDWGSRALRRKGREIGVSSAKVSSALGRQATHEEIANDLGMSFDELHDANTRINSLYLVGQTTDSAGEAGSSQDLIEAAADNGENDPFKLCLKGENRDLLIKALGQLSDREQKIVQLYYTEELTMREIGEVFNLTVTRISQIHAAAIVKLRRMMNHPASAAKADRVRRFAHDNLQAAQAQRTA